MRAARLPVIFAAFVVAVPMGRATVSGASERRSVLLLIADDLGMDHLGCCGNPDLKTPNIDALAGEGTRFSHAFCTTASCSPSRSVLFTGLHNHANGQYGLAHAAHNFHGRAGTFTIFKALKAAGYQTGLIGKKHVLPDANYPIDSEPPANAKDPASMGKATARFLGQTGERPFLLVVGFTDPHRPFRPAAAADAAAGKRKTGKPQPNAKRAGAAQRVRYDPAKIAMPDYLPDCPEARQDVADYFACISRLDEGVGAVLKALQDSGRADETLAIFLSDNGMPFPGAKTTTYEPGIRLPVIVRMPGAAKRGVVNDAMLSYVDIAPTILDWTRAKAPDGIRLHGRSALALVGATTATGWDEIYCSHSFHEVTMYYPMRVVRGRRFKLIWNLAAGLEFPFASDLYQSPTWQSTLAGKPSHYGRRRVEDYLRRPPFELYDLEADPGETCNLADSPAHAAKLLELKQKLFDFQTRTADPWAVKQRHE